MSLGIIDKASAPSILNKLVDPKCACGRTPPIPRGFGVRTKCDECQRERYKKNQRAAYLRRREKILKPLKCSVCDVEIKPDLGKRRDRTCIECVRAILGRYYAPRFCLFCMKKTKGKSYYCSRTCSQKMFFFIKKNKKRIDDIIVD